MKIGDLAKRLDTTVRTLRFYEEQGLIRPRRTARGTRIYDEEAIERFRAILRLAELKLPLADMQRLAAMRPASRSGDEASHRVSDLLDEWQVALEQQRRRIARMQDDLRRAQTLVRQCFGCERPPTRSDCAACPVARHLDSAQTLRLIWDMEVDHE